MSQKILFFGNERLATGVTTGAPTLRKLIADGYEISALIIAQAELGKSRQARELEIGAVAEQHNIPIVVIDDLAGSVEQLNEFGAELGVLVAYGTLVPQSVIDLFARGIVNIHPSLLPKHRGSIPIESVLLTGDTKTGVSLMQLAVKMDAGPIFAQVEVALSGDETKQQLADQLAQLGSRMVAENLPKILNGELVPSPQDESQATEDSRISKQDSLLDFSHSAVELERQIRAYAGWPRSRTKLKDTDIIVTSAHVAEGSGRPGELVVEANQLGIYCVAGILFIDSLIPAGKKEMSGSAFISGYL